MSTSTLRNTETEKKYTECKASAPANHCFLCSDSAIMVDDFSYWRIVKNDFPYDLITSVHDLLQTKRHVASEFELTSDELSELMHIKRDILSKSSYDSILENLPRTQTIPTHLHFHLLNFKK